mgnify:CR=1 FL=1
MKAHYLQAAISDDGTFRRTYYGWHRSRFQQDGHGQREGLAPERVGTLQEPYLHYSFSKG